MKRSESAESQEEMFDWLGWLGVSSLVVGRGWLVG